MDDGARLQIVSPDCVNTRLSSQTLSCSRDDHADLKQKRRIHGWSRIQQLESSKLSRDRASRHLLPSALSTPLASAKYSGVKAQRQRKHLRLMAEARARVRTEELLHAALP